MSIYAGYGIRLRSFYLYITACPFVYFLKRLQKKKSFQTQTEDSLSIGLFHPYCNTGSGSERVLWVALKCLQIR
jgi:alpha-1,2-mannosyltransferase